MKGGDFDLESPREVQYSAITEYVAAQGEETLGPRGSESWANDPKHLVFRLARYKFVAKMFSGFDSVLEVGCGDAFASRIVQAEVGKFAASDFDPLFVADAQRRMREAWAFDVFVHDPTATAVPGPFRGIFALDVLEHIPQMQEHEFMTNILEGLAEDGVLIVGIPSLESQTYASEQSRQGHVNCKTGSDLKSFLNGYFRNVFLFSMNDEVVHTGHEKMAHYLFGLCTNKRVSRVRT